jgi:hypothetical protein
VQKNDDDKIFLDYINNSKVEEQKEFSDYIFRKIIGNLIKDIERIIDEA